MTHRKRTRAKAVAITVAMLFLIFFALLWHVVTDFPQVLKPRPSQETPIGVLIDNVRLISMVPGAPDAEDAQAVLVLGDRVVEVGAAGQIAAPEGVLTIDAQGRTLIPGLIDAHVHLNDEAELAGYLAHGVTGLRNMSAYPFHLPLAKRIKEGRILGPDLMTTGQLLNSRGPNETILQRTVTTDAEARAAVRDQYKAGYHTLKLYSNLKREAFDAIMDEAAMLGMQVVGHSPEGERIAGIPHRKPFEIPWEASLGRGFTTFEHIETLVWHSLRGEIDEQGMQEVAAKLALSGEAVTTTLIAHKVLVLIAETQGAYLQGPGFDTINPLVRLAQRSDAKYWSEVDPAVYEGPRAEFYLKATRILHEAGVSLIAATDAGLFAIVPGASMARELELLVEAGLSPHDALASATRISAQVLGFEQTGVIAPGYRANLVLLPEDPLLDIGIVEFPTAVMIGGYWMDELKLEELRKAARDSSLIRSAWRALHMLMRSY
ncbi:MAG: amidohydrolase family protein [Idiomarina sp.]|nr:amidohydrolase family protein [Idiomarina sp.]